MNVHRRRPCSCIRGKHAHATSRHHCRHSSSLSITHTSTTTSEHALRSFDPDGSYSLRRIPSTTGPSVRRTSTKSSRLKSYSYVGVIVSVRGLASRSRSPSPSLRRGVHERRRVANASGRSGNTSSVYGMEVHRHRKFGKRRRSMPRPNPVQGSAGG